MTITLERLDGTPIPFKAIGFSGGERHVQLDLSQGIPDEVTIRARINSSDDLMDLFNLNDALWRHSAHIAVNLELPYMPYGRQDRVCAPGQAHGLDLIGNMINEACFDSIVTWDAHSWQTLAKIRAHEVEPALIMERDKVLAGLLELPNTILVAPDAGARQRVLKVAQHFGLGENQILECTKHRDSETGILSDPQIPDTNLDGKVLIIIDDICDGGYTFIQLSQALKRKGVQCIYLYVTHGIFSKGLQALWGQVGHIWTSDSKPLPPDAAGFPNFLTTIPYKHAF